MPQKESSHLPRIPVHSAEPLFPGVTPLHQDLMYQAMSGGSLQEVLDGIGRLEEKLSRVANSLGEVLDRLPQEAQESLPMTQRRPDHMETMPNLAALRSRGSYLTLSGNVAPQTLNRTSSAASQRLTRFASAEHQRKSVVGGSAHSTLHSDEDSEADTDRWPGNILPRTEAFIHVRSTFKSRGADMTRALTAQGTPGTRTWKGKRSMTLHPNSLFRAVVDFASLVMLGYDMMVIPVVLAWDKQHVVLDHLAWMSTIFWTLDIFLSSITGYYRKGELEMRSRKVFKHYLKKWFPIDSVVIVVDWLQVVLFYSGASASELGAFEVPVRAMKLGRFLRLISVLRMLQLSYRVEMLIDRFLSDTTRMIGLVTQITLLVMWVSHVAACIWYSMGVGGRSDAAIRG